MNKVLFYYQFGIFPKNQTRFQESPITGMGEWFTLFTSFVKKSHMASYQKTS